MNSIEGKARSQMESSESTREYRYPLLNFDIPAEKLVSRKLYEAGQERIIEQPDGERVRVVLQALKDAGASDYIEASKLSEREKTMARRKQFLSQTALIRYESKFGAEERVVQRKHLIDRERANKAVLTELAKTHDPVWQVLDYVNQQFGEQLSADKMTTLCNDVLTVTHWKELHAQYLAQVAVKRETIQPTV
jgi:hypothetical protein